MKFKFAMVKGLANGHMSKFSEFRPTFLVAHIFDSGYIAHFVAG